MPHSYLTADLPGVGGLIKAQPDDFLVEELPLYPPAGQGAHCYFVIEKRGISTLHAANLLARALGRRAIDIGYAGLKDAQAVARQTFSIELETEDRIRSLSLPQVRILEVSRHRNKLKIGHLAGNRFTVKIRNDDWAKPGGSVEEARLRARATLDSLGRSGVPNFFGPQRFGMRGDNHWLGAALLRGQSEEFLRRWLGEPDPRVDHGPVLQARRHFAHGRMDLALADWPGHLSMERRALAILARNPAHGARAMRSVDVRLKRLLVSALQAHLFNETLLRRLKRLDRILPGDLAWKHDNGAVFEVGMSQLHAAAEQPRCDAHEISPSGPMFGYRMTPAQGEPGQMEDEVLAAHELTPRSFHQPRFATGGGGAAGGAEKSKGSRRAMRFFPTELDLASGADQRGPFLQLRFVLPPGCFATVLLGEIMKTDLAVD